VTESDNPSKDKYVLSESENRRIFTKEIVPIELGNLIPAISPSVHFFGSQPGAGKSQAQLHVKESLAERDNERSIAIIAADDFRQYHPAYKELAKERDDLSSIFTSPDAGRWLEQAIDYTAQLKPHVILEGTLRNPQGTLDVASRYCNAGFSEELHILAVHEFVSRLRVFDRYLNQVELSGHGRYVPTKVHDEAYDMLPKSLEMLVESELFKKVTLYDAYGNPLINTDGTAENTPILMEVLNKERKNDSIDFEQLLDWAEQIAIHAKEVSRPVILGDLEQLIADMEYARAGNS
jgi:UDP-N-acetylglucosamine kinase